VVITPNSGNGTGTTTSAAAVASTATGTPKVGSTCQYQGGNGEVLLVNGKYYCGPPPPAVGSACQYENVTGTVTLVDGKYSCVYTPPAKGSACEYQNNKGTVTLVKGARYCKISEAEASSTDTIVQRQKDAVGSAEAQTAQLQSTADEAAARIQASSSDKSALVEVVRTKNVDRASALLLQNGFSSKQLEGARIELVDKTGGGGGGGAASRVKVTIRVDCCPLVITITISF